MRTFISADFFSFLPSLQYLKTLREQMYEARDMRSVPLLVVGNKQDLLPSAITSGMKHRDIVNLIRKHWRCGYIECSAKYNYRVVQVIDIFNRRKKHDRRSLIKSRRNYFSWEETIILYFTAAFIFRAIMKRLRQRWKWKRESYLVDCHLHILI